MWKDLDEYLEAPTVHTLDGRTLTVAGGLRGLGRPPHQRGLQVLQHAGPRRGARSSRSRALAGAGKPLWPTRATKLKRGRGLLFPIGVDSGKDTIYARLRSRSRPATRPVPGALPFPGSAATAWFFEQLTAETCITEFVKGFPQRRWTKPNHVRNEALDCRVYSFAALIALAVKWPREIEKAGRARGRRGRTLGRAVDAAAGAEVVEAKRTRAGFGRRVMRSRFMG